MAIISVKDVQFQYDDKLALDRVSFDITSGSVTALVGPNGAGKTTLLRCLVGLEKPISGQILVEGIDVADNPRAAHRRCGYLSDDFGVYEQLTVRQSLTYMAWCQGIAAARITPRIAELGGMLGIGDKLDMAAGALSRGNRQRLGIALALIHDPKIMILDEPAAGLDPEARGRLSALMQHLKALGKTIIVSSHILNELEDYCTDMLVIRDGRVSDHVVLQDYNRAQVATMRVTVGAIPDASLGEGAAAQALARIAAIAGARDARRDPAQGDAILFECDNTSAAQAELLQKLIAAGIAVAGYAPVGRKLQDAYMDLAGRDGANPAEANLAEEKA